MNEKQLRAELDAVYGSLSWRLTAPLRLLSLTVRRLGFVLRAPKQAARRIVQKIANHPRLGPLGRRVLNRFPHMKARLRHNMLAPAPVKAVAIATDEKLDPQQLSGLTPSAQQLYHKLRHLVVTQR